MKSIKRLKKSVVGQGVSSSAKERNDKSWDDNRQLLEDAEKHSRSSTLIDATEPRTENHGLFKLAGPEQAQSRPGLLSYNVDIVAVHGLNGDAFSTWRHSSSGILWPRDLLPELLPGCQVYTYGYPSKICSQSFARIPHYAQNLLSHLAAVRDNKEARKRPIIFICHSLGGIVVKQALVTAHADNHQFGPVLRSISGVIFLATPHQGSDLANFASVLGSIVDFFVSTTSAGIASRPIRNDLLKCLIRDSEQLHDLAVLAKQRLRGISVVSCFETMATPPLTSLLVRPSSAVLNIPDEQQIPMYEDHRSICRFAGRQGSFELLAAALVKVALQTLRGNGGAADQSSTRSSDIFFNPTETRCVELLNDHDVSKDEELPPLPIAGTCQWIRRHHMFVSWLGKASNTLLWLTGHPGSGKTTLAYSLAQYLRETGIRSRNVLVYMCQNKNKQTDGKAVLIGLILQIVNQHRSLIRHVRKVFEMQGVSMVKSFPLLWRLFQTIITDGKAGCTYVVLDALDECEPTSRQKLLSSISDMLTDTAYSKKCEGCVKFLVTSRPFLHNAFVGVEQGAISQVSVDENQDGYMDDIQTFIRERVNAIATSSRYSKDIRDFLRQSITAKADQTFLWIQMVLSSIERYPMTSRKSFEEILSSIPSDLAATYERYLSAIPANHKDEASKMLKLLVASTRPLQLDELNIAFTIDASHSTADEILQDGQDSMAHTVQGVLGPLVRISGQRVHLVHQSLKEYLAGQREGPSIMEDVQMENPALQLATVCIQYLMLDDFDVDLFAQNTCQWDDDVFGTSQLLNDLPPGDASSESGDDASYNLNSDFMFCDEEANHQDLCSLLTSKYAFYSYASLNWMEHFAQCEEMAPHDLRSSAMTLLNSSTSNCRNWLQFYRARATSGTDDELLKLDPVGLASRFDSLTTLEHLLRDGEPQQTTLDRSLYQACHLGHDRIVACLCRNGADVNYKEPLDRGQTPLAVASEHGNLKCVVRLLAEQKINAGVRGRSGRTPLSFACRGGHYEIVNELLRQAGKETDQEDDSGATPFIQAVGGGHHRIMSTLVKRHGVNVNHCDKTGRTAASWAAGDGMADTLAALAKLPRVQLSCADGRHRTPLSWAAGNGHVDAVEILLTARAVDKNSVDGDGRNAISWACSGGHDAVLRKLLDAGCDGADALDVDGWTPLAWAIQNDSPETVEMLVSHASVELDRGDHGGRTALSWAVEYGHLRVVRVLLKAGADAHASSANGRTPMSVAMQYGRQDMLDELLAYRKE